MNAVVAIIPVRMDSRRLPGKALKNVGRYLLIELLVNRLASCEVLDAVVVATTRRPVDDALERWCASHDVLCFRGSALVDDVLQRMCQAARAFDAQIVVRANGDSPLIAPEAVAIGIGHLRDSGAAVVTGKRQYSGLPAGLGPEIIDARFLVQLNEMVQEPHHREHVTSAVFERESGWIWSPIPIPEIWHAPWLDLTVDDPVSLDCLTNVVALLSDAIPMQWSIMDIIDAAKTVVAKAQRTRDHRE